MSKLGKVTGFQKWLHLASCFGASIVIVGALFKIMHWPGASIALIFGLGTEAILFCLFGINIPHEEVDWTLAYPELSGMAHDDHDKENESNLPITTQLDNLLADAKIGPELIESLSTGMRSLGDSANKIADISNSSVATNEYVDSVKNASKNVNQLADSYSKASNSIATLIDSDDATKSISESLTNVSKNLTALNVTYELQLQGNKENLDSTSKFYGGLNELMTNLTDSVDDTKKYRQEMATFISNATVATNDYVDSVKNASNNANQLADTYTKASNSIASIIDSGDSSSAISESLINVSKNLSALNATYELQLQGNKENLNATSKFYDDLNQLMTNLSDSVDDTKKYRQEMASLSTNLTALNTVYGNMLSAMNIKP